MAQLALGKQPLDDAELCSGGIKTNKGAPIHDVQHGKLRRLVTKDVLGKCFPKSSRSVTVDTPGPAVIVVSGYKQKRQARATVIRLKFPNQPQCCGMVLGGLAVNQVPRVHDHPLFRALGHTADVGNQTRQPFCGVRRPDVRITDVDDLQVACSVGGWGSITDWLLTASSMNWAVGMGRANQ